MTTVAVLRRVRLNVRGTVQGVGFRPFVYRLAHELGVAGWVANDNAGAIIEAEAAEPVLHELLRRLRSQLPPHAAIVELAEEWGAATGERGFRISHSDSAGEPRALVLPDLATCDECRRELSDPANRRRLYAFTNCTHCGPRYTIIRSLPYDRVNTTMAGFTLCPECRAEYEDPGNRRFHAQPNACPVCGPHLAYVSAGGELLVDRADDQQALLAAAADVANGRIVAVKGIGGYLLVCDARSERAVATLRERKRRPSKPFAVMAPSLEAAAAIVELDDAARTLLTDATAPIVLLPRRADSPLAEGVAPGNPYLGVMLPYAPLLHLLMDLLRIPVVATSGNLSEEPICTDDDDALERLAEIADTFLAHDRPIRRHVDDSVAWIVDGAPRLLRRARGHAPLPVRLSHPVPPLLAVGGHMKNAVAVARGLEAFVSQHIGDLETHESQGAFAEVIEDLLTFYRVTPVAVAHDLHPDYASTRWAVAAGSTLGDHVALLPVQHHHAHLASCLAEHGVAGEALGIIWDGTGYGTDGTIWGGEFLLGDAAAYRRVGHLRAFNLAGGDAAIHEPDRIALSLLHQLHGDDAFDRDLPVVNRIPEAKRRVLRKMIGTGFNAPRTSSMGRLFDGVAALLDLVESATFEGEAAMALEFAALRAPSERGHYPLPLAADRTLDWRPTIFDILEDVRAGVPRDVIAARFHNALIGAALAVADRAGCRRVALSGGCFQNRILATRLPAALRARGFEVLQHRVVPPNDGGVALGQIAVAAARLRERKG